MVDVLDDQRTATRFRVLVEIAERQPAVSQGEIADALGVTSQAVSRYIQELIEEGFVAKEGRSRYRITTEGVDWLLAAADDVRRFADHVTEDVLGGVSEDAAIAGETIEEGETVTLQMQDGLLHAVPGDEGPATGVATTSGDAGEAIGVTNFDGVIDLEAGSVTVLQVPAVREAETENRPTEATIREVCETADLVLVAGVEAVVALREQGLEPAITVAAGEVAVAASSRGLDVAVVVSADLVGRVTDPLRDAGVSYSVAGE